MTKQPAGNVGRQETVTPLGESSPAFKYSTGPLAENWTQDCTVLPLSASFWKLYRREPFLLHVHSAFWKLEKKQTKQQKNPPLQIV